MQLGPIHFNLDVSVADLLVVIGAAFAATRTIVHWLKHSVIDQLKLHEKALLKAGWLRENSRGEVYVPDHVGRTEGRV